MHYTGQQCPALLCNLKDMMEISVKFNRGSVYESFLSLFSFCQKETLKSLCS